MVDIGKYKKAILSTHHAVFELHEIGSCSKMKGALVSVRVLSSENRFRCVMLKRIVNSLTILIHALYMVDMYLTFVCVYVSVCICHKVLCCWVKEVNEPSVSEEQGKTSRAKTFSPRLIPPMALMTISS